MANIQFSYLYRDNSNYKNYGFVIFNNRYALGLADVEIAIKNSLIDQTWFYPMKWKLPCLYFDEWNDDIDNSFHEFDGVMFTNNSDSTDTDIFDFLNRIKTS